MLVRLNQQKHVRRSFQSFAQIRVENNNNNTSARRQFILPPSQHPRCKSTRK